MLQGDPKTACLKLTPTLTSNPGSAPAVDQTAICCFFYFLNVWIFGQIKKILYYVLRYLQITIQTIKYLKSSYTYYLTETFLLLIPVLWPKHLGNEINYFTIVFVAKPVLSRYFLTFKSIYLWYKWTSVFGWKQNSYQNNIYFYLLWIGFIIGTHSNCTIIV